MNPGLNEITRSPRSWLGAWFGWVDSIGNVHAGEAEGRRAQVDTWAPEMV